MSVNEHRTQPADKKYEALRYSDECSRTFVFGDEDHTLGNSLRHVLICRPETTFCGYSVPHPYEPKMNLRLQTRGKAAVEVLRDGLREMMAICDLLEARVDQACAKATPPKPNSGRSRMEVDQEGSN